MEEGVDEGIRKIRGTSITFGTDDFHEARELASRLHGYEPDDFLKLSKGEAILRTRYHGRTVAPVKFQTVVDNNHLRSYAQTQTLRQTLKETTSLYTHDGEAITGLW